MHRIFKVLRIKVFFNVKALENEHGILKHVVADDALDSEEMLSGLVPWDGSNLKLCAIFDYFRLSLVDDNLLKSLWYIFFGVYKPLVAEIFFSAFSFVKLMADCLLSPGRLHSDSQTFSYSLKRRL